MADSTISGLPNSLSTPDRDNDLLVIDDVSANETKKCTPSQLFSSINTSDIPSPATTAGDVVVHDGISNVRLAVGSPFTVLTSIPTAPQKVAWVTPFNNLQYQEYFEDFTNGSVSNYYGFTANNNAGSITMQTPPSSDVIGMARMSTNASATARCSLSTYSTAFALGIGTYDFTVKAKIDILSDGTNTFIVSLGMSNALSSNAQHGLFFRYNQAASSNWILVRRVNNVETSEDTGIAVVAGTWYKLRVVSLPNLTEEAYINNTSLIVPAGTLDSAEFYGFHTTILKSVGTTPRTIDVDYYHLKCSISEITR